MENVFPEGISLQLRNARQFGKGRCRNSSSMGAQLGLFHQFPLSTKQDPGNIWSLRYWRFRIELFSDRSVSALLSPPASQQFKFNNIQKIHLSPHVNQQSFAHFHIEYILFTPPGKTRRKTFTNFLFLTHKVSETCCLSENGNNTGLCVF